MSKLIFLAIFTQALLTTIQAFHPIHIANVRLQADNGQFLRVNPHIGGAKPGFAVSVEDHADHWEMLRIGDKVALRAPNGNYLSRCRHCWHRGAYVDSAFVHLNNPYEPWSQWRAIRQHNGKWVFQSDVGTYLARCNNCANARARNLGFVHEHNPHNPWAQWNLV